MCIATPASGQMRADPENPEQVAQGKGLYEQYCASCHGANLEGEANWRRRKPNGRLPAPPHDRSGHTWHHTDSQIFEVTKRGVKPPLVSERYQSDMDGFAEKLRDAEIWAIIAYIKSRWPQDIRERQPGTTKNQPQQ